MDLFRCGRDFKVIYIRNSKDKNGKRVNRFIPYARYLYAKHYGTIKKGEHIFYLDGNRMNVDINNLVAVPAKFQQRVASEKTKFQNKELFNSFMKTLEVRSLYWKKIGKSSHRK